METRIANLTNLEILKIDLSYNYVRNNPIPTKNVINSIYIIRIWFYIILNFPLFFKFI